MILDYLTKNMCYSISIKVYVCVCVYIYTHIYTCNLL